MNAILEKEKKFIYTKYDKNVAGKHSIRCDLEGP